MLEIILIVLLSLWIARSARAKGRGAAGWVILFIALFLVGWLLGAIGGAALSIATTGAGQPSFLIWYGGAWLGAAIGAVIGVVVVNSLPSLTGEDEFWRPPVPDASKENFDPTAGDSSSSSSDRFRPRHDKRYGTLGDEDPQPERPDDRSFPSRSDEA